MVLRMTPFVSVLILSACTGPDTRVADLSAGQCLYAAQDGPDRGRHTRWSSCSAPPPLAIGLISGKPLR
jgi:hypothetical protein